jgi:hypothetical protein
MQLNIPKSQKVRKSYRLPEFPFRTQHFEGILPLNRPLQRLLNISDNIINMLQAY